jgi:hypothetical protein
MILQTTRRPAIFMALMSLTSMVLFGALSAQAQAGCNHRAVSLEAQQLKASLFSMRLFTLVAAGEALPPGRSPWTKQDNEPCSGSGCSNPTVPTEAPVSHSVDLDQDWCLGTLSAELAPRSLAQWEHSLQILTCIQFPTSIDRPPRGL